MKIFFYISIVMLLTLYMVTDETFATTQEQKKIEIKEQINILNKRIQGSHNNL